MATCDSGCGVCTECRAACDLSHTLHGTQHTHHNLNHMFAEQCKTYNMYFYWLILQKCNFGQAQHKLPEDGPDGPKCVGTNIRYFNGKNILYV